MTGQQDADMPGLFRKLVIFAAVDGLVLQPQGLPDASTSLRIDFRTQKLTQEPSSPTDDHSKRPSLESHGIVGLLSVASLSYLIAITRREQVAQIFGKPVYVITDVALLPLSSQREAENGITAASKQRDFHDSDADSSDDEPSKEENNEDHSTTDTLETDSPTDDVRSDVPSKKTNIAQDVFARRGQYQNFASQWFSKKGWGIPGIGVAPDTGNKVSESLDKSSHTQPPSEKGETLATPDEAALDPSRAADMRSKDFPLPNQRESAVPLLTKLLRSTRLLLSSRSFYFAYELDITKRLGELGALEVKPLAPENIDPLYFWNRNLGSPFMNSGFSTYLMPIMQGFVGQRHFIVKRNSKEHLRTEAFESLESVLKADEAHSPQNRSKSDTAESQQPFLLTLISRRSTKRSGLRYLRRGIDDNGNCANTVETEQILSSPTWDPATKYRSFVQIRGSIPLYFSQTPYAFKPVPVLHQSASTNRAAFERHFHDLNARYGSVHIALLVDKHGGEARIGEEYEKATNSFNDTTAARKLGFEWFDFHEECRGMKFENVDRLVKTLEIIMDTFGETVIQNKEVQERQNGIIRTNCMDCLDRTNVAQSAFAQYVLQKDLEDEGFEIDLLHDESTQWFNTLWADNGDAVSREYASTAALKGDFTRTRKRNYRGALNDFGLTISRYYNNMFNDYFSQAVIDVLLGNVSAKVFEDFEANMMSADPGISIEKIREHAIETCRKIVIQAPDEDLIHAWPMLSPAQPNTLRTLPFEESVLLLTDAALYDCRFDWTTEKVLAFEKIDLRAITKIHYGTYITSTFTDRQMDESLNVGITIIYTPGKESVVRVNTRSLQSSLGDDPKLQDANKSTSSNIVSWLGSRPQASSRTMALKLISNETSQETDTGKLNSHPIDLAQRICEDIRRAVIGGNQDEKDHLQMVEKTDIISLEEARKRVGYIEQLGHSIKKLVWT